MADKITSDMIDYVAVLAKLELTEEEREGARRDMGRMLDYIDMLDELDTSGVEPMSHIFPLQNVFREDEPADADGREETLCNAPERKEDMFVVPKVVE